MPDPDSVRYEERDSIAIITLSRPEKLNTLNESVIQGVADGIDAATLDAIDKEQSDRVDAADAAAQASGPPPLEIADTDLWADGGSSWRN